MSSELRVPDVPVSPRSSTVVVRPHVYPATVQVYIAFEITRQQLALKSAATTLQQDMDLKSSAEEHVDGARQESLRSDDQDAQQLANLGYKPQLNVHSNPPPREAIEHY